MTFRVAFFFEASAGIRSTLRYEALRAKCDARVTGDTYQEVTRVIVAEVPIITTTISAIDIYDALK